MKLLLCFIFILAVVPEGFAQGQKGLSPKETVNETLDGVGVEIVYCSPSARGRRVMGELVPFGEVWRTGANAATTISFDKAVKIEGKPLAAGKYELFTIPGQNEWTIIFQKFSQQWGAFSYKPANDVLRVTVKPRKTENFQESFTIGTKDDQVVLSWENTLVSFRVKS